MQTAVNDPIRQDYVDRIGNLLLNAVPQPHARILLVAELDDGYMGSQLVWHEPGAASLSTLALSGDAAVALSEAAIDVWDESAH